MKVNPYQIDQLVTIKRGDTMRGVYDNLLLGTNAISLISSSVFFVMYDPATDTATRLSASVTEPISGSVSYLFQSSDINTTGSRLCEWEITDASNNQLTLPTGTYIKLNIIPDLG